MRHVLLPYGISLLASIIAYGQVPPYLSFQGVLGDAGGHSVADGTYSLVFELHTDAVAPNLVWSEAHEVTTAHGIYNVILGGTNPLTTVDFDREVWLQIVIEGEALSPRLLLTPTPSSFVVRNRWTGYSGMFDTSPVIYYTCTLATSRIVAMSEVTFDDRYPSLTAAANSGYPGEMSGEFNSETAFEVTRVVTGGCIETYTLTGSFLDRNHFTGTLTVDFEGTLESCGNCSDQSWGVAGTRQ